MFITTGMYEFEGGDLLSYYEYWIGIFRFCIGDTPDGIEYEFWDNYKEEHPSASWMIFFIMVIYVSLLFLMIVVLLNFLIAVISQTYENIMTQKLHTQYKHKAILNRECRLNLKSLGMGGYFDSFILSAQTYHDIESEEWLGFVNSIRTDIQSQN